MFAFADAGSAGGFGIGLVLIIAAVIVGIAAAGVVVIDAGQVGVTKIWGTVGDEPVQAGLHIVTPFITDIQPFDVKTQVDTQTTDVLTAEGLTCTVEMSMNYRVDPTKAPQIYKTIGMEYKSVVIDPEIRSAVRDTVATFDAKSIYSSDRTNISAKIQREVEKPLAERGIIVESILLRSVKLPQKVVDAIEAKQQMEQQIQQKQFEVEKESQEANRKRVEAQGIADANKIISDSITPGYIEWYTVDMLKTHHSDAMMYIPTGSNGLPLISNIPVSAYKQPVAAATPAPA